VLDAGGRRIAALDGTFGAGRHQWQWDGRLAGGSRVSAGLYFVRLTTPYGDRVQRLVRLD
jgi:flagellar hook assembly protein FlgD